jgi:transposase
VTGSAVYSDSWQDYNALDVSSFKHYRVNPSALFSDAHNYINRIEHFWN